MLRVQIEQDLGTYYQSSEDIRNDCGKYGKYDECSLDRVHAFSRRVVHLVNACRYYARDNKNSTYDEKNHGKVIKDTAFRRCDDHHVIYGGFIAFMLAMLLSAFIQHNKSFENTIDIENYFLIEFYITNENLKIEL